MFGASLLELFKGEPFSKAQKHHCFCWQGAGNTLINQGGFWLLWGGCALEGGCPLVLGLAVCWCADCQDFVLRGGGAEGDQKEGDEPSEDVDLFAEKVKQEEAMQEEQLRKGEPEGKRNAMGDFFWIPGKRLATKTSKEEQGPEEQTPIKKLSFAVTPDKAKNSQASPRASQASPQGSEASPKGSEASSGGGQSTPGSGRKVQYAIGKFFSPGRGGFEPVMSTLPLSGKAKDRRTAEERMHETLRKEGVLTLAIEGSEKPRNLTEEEMEAMSKKLHKLNPGGRPLKPDEERRGVQGGRSSNRRKASEKPLKHEMSFAEKKRLLDTMEAEKDSFSSPGEFWSHFSKKFGLRQDRLKEVWSTKDSLKEAVAANVEAGKKKSSKRKRREGGGAKLNFPDQVRQLRLWLEQERSHGHTVLKRHLLWKYLDLLKNVEEEMMKEAEGEEDQTKRRQLLQKAEEAKKQVRNSSGGKAAERKAAWLSSKVGAKNLRPNLKTTLSRVEQEARALLTWQQHDEDLRLLAYGSTEELAEYFAA